MANTVTLTFAGDADQLERASKKAEQSVVGVGKAATSASQGLDKAAKSSGDYLTRVGKLGAAVEGASTAIDDASAAVSAFAQLQQVGAQRAQRQARALNEVAQAQEDFNQALQDGRQAAADAQQAQIDARQATLDAKVAQADYSAAVKEHGKNSAEAMQASIDLAQAQQDLQQANLDNQQATRDASQATIDAKSAQLDLNDATREAHPPDSQKWADNIATVTPILQGLVGVVGLVTAAQWAWNIAQLASPTTWIILAIVALIAVIVLIATKTTWFQDLWRKAWSGIKTAAAAVWDWLKKVPGWIGQAFKTVAGAITAPFRAAFNFISDAWNHTVGSLSWTVPNWIPGIGGRTIAVPNLPKFHEGGIVPGVPGQEVLAVLQAGERVTPLAGSRGDAVVIEVKSGGTMLDDLLVQVLQKAIRQGRITALRAA